MEASLKSGAFTFYIKKTGLIRGSVVCVHTNERRKLRRMKDEIRRFKASEYSNE